MKYVAVARNTQTNDPDLRSLQNLLRKLLQGQNNHFMKRHFNQETISDVVKSLPLYKLILKFASFPKWSFYVF